MSDGAPTRTDVRIAAWLRTRPVTCAYVVLLLCTHVIVDEVLSRSDADRLLRYLSTNLDNLEHHPVVSLLGSALVVDGSFLHVFTLDFGGVLITFVLGVAVVLGELEHRFGLLRAYGVFAAGHIGATLLTAPVISFAIADGWYPESIRTTYDFGISYGAQAALACATFVLVPRRARVLWALGVVAWPLGGMSWMTALPDFTTVGHLYAAAIGFATGLVLARTGVRRG